MNTVTVESQGGSVTVDVPAPVQTVEVIVPAGEFFAVEAENSSIAAAASAAASLASEVVSTAKAGEASASASAAITKASEASASASTASTKAGEALASATGAASSESAAASSASAAEASQSAASSSATSASNSASTATTKAGESSASATSASSSAATATTKAGEASASATSAASSAATATTKAGEASASAAAAASSASSAAASAASINPSAYATAAQGTKADSALQDSDTGTSAGKIVKLDGSARLPAVDGSLLTGIGIKSGTAINTTSGTAHDFTGIPAGVKRITLLLSGVSTNGTSPYLVQLGDSGGIETTGYASSTMYVTGAYPGAVGTYSHTTGAGIVAVPTAADNYRGRICLENLTGNLWLITGTMSDGNARGYKTDADKTLSATLDRIRLTTVNGTDVFDAGQINILYE